MNDEKARVSEPSDTDPRENSPEAQSTTEHTCPSCGSENYTIVSDERYHPVSEKYFTVDFTTVIRERIAKCGECGTLWDTTVGSESGWED